MKEYAPCLISVYNRVFHFKRCIGSLAECPGASSTPLFIAIDAPYRKEDVAANQAIIEYAQMIHGFKSINIIRRATNVGAFNNVRMAQEEIFRTYGKIIISEDDNIFAPYFLEFVNDGLSYYESDPTIFSICGYSYPLDFSKCSKDDAFALRAFSAWGVGYWKEKFEKVDYQCGGFLGSYYNLLKVVKLNKAVGPHIFAGLVVSKLKNEIYGDTAITYHLYKNDMLSIFPRVSLVRNMGNDGSGLHSGVCSIYERQEIDTREYVSPHLDATRENKCARLLVNDHFRLKPMASLFYYLTYCFLSLREQVTKNRKENKNV